MGRRRSSRTSYSFHRRAPYNLRSRTRKPKYLDFLDEENADKKAGTHAPLPKVHSTDLHKSDNSHSHHTEKYDLEDLVIRRGQSFSLTVTLNRSINDDEDICIIFTTGRTPYPSKGTLLMFPLMEKSSNRFGWKMLVSSSDQKTFELNLTPSHEAIIGAYEMMVNLTNTNTSTYQKLKCKLYLIFNPWCLQDDVFMEDEKSRDEYILNETGRIWVGSRSSYYGKPWVFGQFESCGLKAALYVLEISDLSDTALSNPVLVCRMLSKMANSFDDDGILEGNWSGDYSGGIEPTDWLSSVNILSQYLESAKPVKYGQCWVFSGVLTTLFRSVGIPARSVTNFESAHDNDGSMTIDRHWNYDDQPLTDFNDSIWNFHVWNEVWFKRHDLPIGHDGWQVVDGTPQERSDGVMQCGPTSLKAIKDGEVYLPYDTKFVVAEVNGDIVEWVKEKTGEMEPVYKETNSVGYFISTKAVGSSMRSDITSNYKYKEGTKEEREVMSRITTYSSRKAELSDIYNDSEPSILFNLSYKDYSNGDIGLTFTVSSKDSNDVTITVTLTCVASYYNGVTGDTLSTTTKQIKLESKQSKDLNTYIEAADYLNKLATDATISIFCNSYVKETGQRYYTRETVAVSRPNLNVRMTGKTKLKTEFPVDISFHNELSINLTECRLIITGPGFESVQPIKLNTRVIKSGGRLNQTFTFRCRSIGTKELVAQLHTRQLQNITGSAVIDIDTD